VCGKTNGRIYSKFNKELDDAIKARKMVEEKYFGEYAYKGEIL